MNRGKAIQLAFKIVENAEKLIDTLEECEYNDYYGYAPFYYADLIRESAKELIKECMK